MLKNPEITLENYHQLRLLCHNTNTLYRKPDSLQIEMIQPIRRQFLRIFVSLRKTGSGCPHGFQALDRVRPVVLHAVVRINCIKYRIRNAKRLLAQRPTYQVQNSEADWLRWHCRHLTSLY